MSKFIPTGLNKCHVCKTTDDPKQVFLKIGNCSMIVICWTCSAPTLKPLLSHLFTDEQLANLMKDPDIPNPDQVPSLPANHPAMLQAAIASNENQKTEE